MHKLVIAAALSFSAIITNAQEIKIPTEAQLFVINGFEPLDYITGDLNGDKKADAILILKQPGEDTFDMDAAAPRPLILLLRQADGKLKQVIRNDKAIMCRQCGGVFGDPYAGTKIAANSFTLSFYGGSNWRWENDYRFVYKSIKKNWYLVKESQANYHTSDPEHSKNVIIEQSELGEVLMEKFDNSYVYEESQWKVKSGKAFFYDNPKLGSQPRKGYLVKGNVVSSIRELTNFIEVSFIDSKEKITTGFILRKDLEKLK